MDLPRLIVLRIWTDPARFRAVARELETECSRSFSDPIELLAYLCGDRVANEALPPASNAPTP